jgi:uncharacterized membrane protein YdbT with pleckstrin-like domain
MLNRKPTGTISMYSESPKMFRGNPLGFILAVVLIAAGIGILILLWWYIDCRTTKLQADRSTVTLERGILSKERIELDIDNIRAVKVYQSLFNRIFSVGKISVFTSGDAPEIEISGMPLPHRFSELVKAANT